MISDSRKRSADRWHDRFITRIVSDRGIVAAILVLHAITLIYLASVHSVTLDEVGHIGSGVSHWKFRQFDLYAVNPPLPRMIATLPIHLLGYPCDWNRYRVRTADRAEFDAGRDFLELNRTHLRTVVFIARIACLPFSIIGAMICHLWARELFGRMAGVVAVAAWCFSPSILGHGSLVTPDVPAAAIGVLACYLFWRWNQSAEWNSVAITGFVLGLAQLTKFTLIVLYPALLLAWLTRILIGRTRTRITRQLCQVAVITMISLYVVNLGYLFEGTLSPLSDYKFSSSAFKSISRCFHDESFLPACCAKIPVPLPRSLLYGIDEQQCEFERGYRSYLRGTHREYGWWHYYAYAVAIKEPIGTLLLLLIAAIGFAARPPGRPMLADLAAVMIPCAIIFAVVSAQRGFNHHMRYVLPAFPFAMILCSGACRFGGKFTARVLPFFCIAGTITSVGFNAPHFLSYFNETIGGGHNGWKHLDNSNVDWGHDLLYVKKWIDRNPASRPLYLVTVYTVDSTLYGVHCDPLPETTHSRPRPGWYVISNHRLVNDPDMARWFSTRAPDASIGYSHRVYRIHEQD
jgi:hypothetical protein